MMLLPAVADAEERVTLEGARIFDEEHRAFEERARNHAVALRALRRRERSLRRSALREEYARQLALAEVAANGARQRTVTELEAQLRETPPESETAADAMLRLAVLTFDESQEHSLAARAENRAEAPQADYSRTLELLERLLSEHPRFPRIDTALFLMAQSHRAMGRHAEACLAWLRLACPNRVSSSANPASPTNEWSAVHDALGVTTEGQFDGPYESCIPAVPASSFLDEAWLQIGGYHFDTDLSERGLELSITAFRHVADRRESPHRELAMYRLAVALHCARRLREAIQTFVGVLDLHEVGEATQNDLGLRREALRALTIVFADGFWENGSQPATTTMLQRLGDDELLPQVRSYVPDVYFGVGRLCFDVFHYHEAIDVFEAYIEHWPLALEAPHVLEHIAQSYERIREFESAIGARRRIEAYGPGSPWATSRDDVDPERFHELASLVQRTTRDNATIAHQIAEQLRIVDDDEQSPSRLQRARSYYERAAATYRLYLERYPTDPDRWILTFHLGTTSFHAGRYGEAAEALCSMRDRNLEPRLQERAADGCARSLAAMENGDSSGNVTEK